MKKTVLLAAMAATSSVFAKVPTLTNVSFERVGQRVTVTYTVADGPAIVTMQVLTNDVPIASSAVANANGDVNKIVDNGKAGVIKWRADSSIAEISLETKMRVQLKAWPVAAPPDYAVFNLNSTAPKADARFYVDADSIPGGIGSEANKTDYLVMRKIPASGCECLIGAPQSTSVNVDDLWIPSVDGRSEPYTAAFTKDYYMAVYEITQGQTEGRWTRQVTPDTRGSEGWKMKPMTRLSYNALRGTTLGADWPTNRPGHAAHDVDAGSLLAVFREKTGVDSMDLPTEAQWEFAARGGVKAHYYDGRWSYADYKTNPSSSNSLVRLGWCKFEASKVQVVGLKAPNPYGLYDMVGNASEWCLDWYMLAAFKTYHKYGMFVDHAGPSFDQLTDGDYKANGGSRILRGGGILDGVAGLAVTCKSSSYANYTGIDIIGARVCCDADMTGLANK